MTSTTQQDNSITINTISGDNFNEQQGMICYKCIYRQMLELENNHDNSDESSTGYGSTEKENNDDDDLALMGRETDRADATTTTTTDTYSTPYIYEEDKTTVMYLKEALGNILSKSAMDKIDDELTTKKAAVPFSARSFRRRMRSANFSVRLNGQIILDKTTKAKKEMQTATILNNLCIHNQRDKFMESSFTSLGTASAAEANSIDVLTESILATLGISETSTIKNDIRQSLKNATKDVWEIATNDAIQIARNDALGQTISSLENGKHSVDVSHKERFTLLANVLNVVKPGLELLKSVLELVINLLGCIVFSPAARIMEPDNDLINYHLNNIRTYYAFNIDNSILDNNNNTGNNNSIDKHQYVADVIFQNLDIFLNTYLFPDNENKNNDVGFTDTQIKKIPLVNSDDIKKLILDSDECMICKEEYTPQEKVGKLLCNHVFHMECIAEWFKRTKTCPVCREVQVFLDENFCST